MMKSKGKQVGILTTSGNQRGVFACNYGAALQGYALVATLREMGYAAYDINYSSEKGYDPQEADVYTKWRMRLKLLFNAPVLKKKLFSILHKNEIELNTEKFRNFIKINDLTYNNGKMYSYDNLKELGSEFDAFICGSDVIWNPYIHNMENDKGFFLDFVPEGKKRIAYAPSIGTSELPDSAKKDFKSLLKKFNALSVREKTGADLIKKETGLDCKVVLDPTLLIDPVLYERINKKPTMDKEKYIAVYKFGNLQHTEDTIVEIQKRLGLPAVLIPSGKVSNLKTNFDIGPGEFLYIIEHSDIVLTDSFHCVVFCIIYHKPFLVFNRTMPGAASNINSRVTDLLETLGLSDRIMNPGQSVNYETLMEIDYRYADKKLEELRCDSRQFLCDALSY